MCLERERELAEKKPTIIKHSAIPEYDDNQAARYRCSCGWVSGWHTEANEKRLFDELQRHIDRRHYGR
jgi:hypothetical protein